LQDTLVSSAIQTVDVATETSNDTVEQKTQTNLLHIRNKYKIVIKYKIQIFSIMLYHIFKGMKIIFFKCRDTIHSAQKLQDTLISSSTPIQTVDVAAETSNNTVEQETQTDLLHVRNKYKIIIKYKIQIFSITLYYHIVKGTKIHRRQQ